MTIDIKNGKYVSSYEPFNIPGAFIVLEFQVYERNGRPSTLNYRGPGNVVSHPTRKDRDILVLGSAYSIWLDEYEVDREPTPESLEYDAGYRKGFKAKRVVTMAQSESWSERKMDGWRDGWQDGKRYRGKP